MKLHEALEIDLQSVNKTLTEIVQTDKDLPHASIISTSIIQLIEAGGKRLRPIMTIVGSRFGDIDAEHTRNVMKAAAMLEYLHMASLIHDDIIDAADTRRGAPALHRTAGTDHALHIANYMMARAMEWAIETDEASSPFQQPTATSKRRSKKKTALTPQEEMAARSTDMAALVTELCIGEYHQLRDRYNYDLTMEQYLYKTKCKTAVLMGQCLKIGAKTAQASAEVCRLLYAFGEALGMAFQISDDLLDFTQTSEEAGKPTGSDLRHGQVTLPVLYALQDPSLGPRIRAVNAQTDPAEIDAIVALITASNALDRSRELIAAYAEQAFGIIEQLSWHPAHEDLQVLANYFMPQHNKEAQLQTTSAC